MKLDDMLESKYLKQSDVDGETLVTCVGVKRVNVAKEDEAQELKWIVKWAEFPKPMVINATNIKRLFKYLGNDTDEWKGGTVILYVDPDIEFGGKVTGGLRVKQASGKAAPKSTKDVNKELQLAADDDFSDEIPF